MSGVKSRMTPPPGPAACTSLRMVEFASVTGSWVGKTCDGMPAALATFTTPPSAYAEIVSGEATTSDFTPARVPGRRRCCCSAGPCYLDERRRAEALGLDAGADHDEPLGLVVAPVGAAVKLVLPTTPTTLSLSISFLASGLLRRVELLVVEDVLDRAAVDAAVVVHALEVGVGDLADRREVDARDQHVDSAELGPPNIKHTKIEKKEKRKREKKSSSSPSSSSARSCWGAPGGRRIRQCRRLATAVQRTTARPAAGTRSSRPC